MKTPTLERSSAAKATWVFVAVFAGWLGFVFVPWPRPPAEPPRAAAKPSPSPLAAYGLPNNPDLDGLPGVFAIWADRAHWVDGKTEIAWWNPGSRRYTYFFEVTRVGAGFHFVPINRPAGLNFNDNPDTPPDEHPLNFMSLSEDSGTAERQMVRADAGVLTRRQAEPVKITLEPARLAPPQPERTVQLKPGSAGK